MAASGHDMRTAGREIDDPFLMRPKDAVQRTQNQQCHVAKRAKRPVAQHHVAGCEFRVQLGHAIQVVRAERSRDHLLKQAAAKVNQRQPVRRGKAATCGLPSWLTKMLLEFWRVGHREAGAIEHEQAVAEPQSGVADTLGHLPRTAREQRLQGLQGQPPAGRAVGLAGHVLARQVRHMVAGHIAK
jgi:hypothetical protein